MGDLVTVAVDPRREREAGGFLSFDDVQERLVQAMLSLWAMPDRERGWMKVKSLWPDVVRHTYYGDYGESASDTVIRPPRPDRRRIAEMEEAFAWVLAVQGDDRKLIGLAVSALASGQSRVPWRRLLRPMRIRMGADGLRMRYGRAMRKVVERANGGNPGGSVSRG